MPLSGQKIKEVCMKQTILQQKLKEFLDKRYSSWTWDEKCQCYYDEAYRSYDDIIDDKTIGDILDSKYPMETLEEKCFEWWGDVAWEHEQEVNVDIRIDTGDANYDFTLNAIYPHYNGREGDEIDDRASLVWLAKTQGYSKKKLQHAFNTFEDSLERHGFLETVYDEVLNCSTPMPALIFPVKMSLGKLIELYEVMHKRDQEGYEWYSENREDCGSIIVGKNVD